MQMYESPEAYEDEDNNDVIEPPVKKEPEGQANNWAF